MLFLEGERRLARYFVLIQVQDLRGRDYPETSVLKGKYSQCHLKSRKRT
jgi:hypothetical protein